MAAVSALAGRGSGFQTFEPFDIQLCPTPASDQRAEIFLAVGVNAGCPSLPKWGDRKLGVQILTRTRCENWDGVTF